MKIFSSTELAKYLGCVLPTITRWLREGLPHSFAGGGYVYDLKEVLEWMQKGPAQRRRWAKVLLSTPKVQADIKKD